MRWLLLLAPLLAVSGGCAERIAEGRVRSALVDGGVPDGTAACMAERMVDRLSLSQLRKLEALKGTTERSVEDYLAAVRRVGDPEVVGVTASSAALCSAGLG